jgi:hypothetical protein
MVTTMVTFTPNDVFQFIGLWYVYILDCINKFSLYIGLGFQHTSFGEIILNKNEANHK